MKKKISKLMTCAFGMLFLAGCATMSPGVSERSVNNVLGVLESGNSQAVAEMTATPFLLDEELLENEARVVWFWDLMADGGFTVKEPVVLQSQPAGETWKNWFEPTPFMNLWFAKYVSDQAVTVHVETEAHEMYIIIDKIKKENKIMALRVLK